MKYLIRVAAIIAATAGVNWSTEQAVRRAQRFEEYIRTGE